VKFTALDAVDLGFRTFLIEDACRGVNLQPGDVRRAIEEMRQMGTSLAEANSLWIDTDEPPAFGGLEGSESDRKSQA
jgi:nicotinamidase-related amidase